MEEQVEDQVRKLPDAGVKQSSRINPRDLIAIGLIIAVIVGLGLMLLDRLALKRDVAAAKIVTDKVIADIAKHDGKAAHSLGTDEFKKTYSADDITKQFNAIELVTGGTPTVESEARGQGTKGKSVFIMYKYPPKLANKSFFVGVTVVQTGDKPWQLTNISGSADPSKVSY